MGRWYWIWDQYRSTNMKLKFGNFQLKELRQFEKELKQLHLIFIFHQRDPHHSIRVSPLHHPSMRFPPQHSIPNPTLRYIAHAQSTKLFILRNPLGSWKPLENHWIMQTRGVILRRWLVLTCFRILQYCQSAPKCIQEPSCGYRQNSFMFREHFRNSMCTIAGICRNYQKLLRPISELHNFQFSLWPQHNSFIASIFHKAVCSQR